MRCCLKRKNMKIITISREFGSGVGAMLGEGDVHLARRYFTMMMYLMLGSSVVFTALGIAVLRPSPISSARRKP